ncbi:hypothetical protein P0153_25550, partial [Klebsiella pneumoniae]
KIGPDPRNFNQRVSLGRNDLLIRTFLSFNTNAAQLVIHFQVLEKLIIRSVDEIIKVKCS